MNKLEPMITSNSGRNQVKVVIKTVQAAKFIDIALQSRFNTIFLQKANI